ncbi:TPA: hypothetical protein M2H97_005506, partial [Escherichia coli]|nr:hypothetical protein [Escherichia coli]
LEEEFGHGMDKVTFDYVLQKKIKSLGCELQRCFTVRLKGDRRGFIDLLVISPDGQRCAVEVDNRSPRQRSLMKIRALPEGISGFVFLRDGKHPQRYIADGVDVIRATRFK